MFCRIRAKTRESSRNRSVEAAIFVEISGILEIGIDKSVFIEEMKIMHPYFGLIMFCAVVVIVIAIVLNKKKK